MTSFLETEYHERAKVSAPKEESPVGLAVGQKWFVLADPETNKVTYFTIVGVWKKVVALLRPSSSAPEYFLLAALRFVEKVLA